MEICKVTKFQDSSQSTFDSHIPLSGPALQPGPGHTLHCTAPLATLSCAKNVNVRNSQETRKCLKYPDNNAYLGIIIIITSCPVVSSAAASVTHPGRDT